MAESTESKSIKELTKAVKDEQKQNRAKLEEIANSTGKSLEAIKDRAKAKQSLQKQDATLKEQKKISGLSARRIKKADVLEQSIASQKEIMEAQKAKLEELGIDSATNKKFQKEELKLAKMQKAQAKATGSADAEDEADKKISDARQNTFLGKIANGITGLGKSTKDKVKEGAGNIMGMLKKFAFGAFAVAILAFLRSPYFDKFLKVIKEQLVPALTTLIDDYIIPVAKVFWDGIVKAWESIKGLFSGLKESFALFGEGKWVEGITKFFSTIGTFLVETLDNIITTIYNSIAAVFGFEGTDSVVGSIMNFFTDIYDKVVSTISNAFTSITTFISEKITAVVDYLKGIFGFDEEGFTFANLFDIVYAPVNLAINLIKDIFGFGSPDEPFRLSEFISNAFGEVVDFFKGLLDFDIKSLVMKLPGAQGVMNALGGIGKFFSGGDNKETTSATFSNKHLMDEAMGEAGAADKPAVRSYRDMTNYEKAQARLVARRRGSSRFTNLTTADLPRSTGGQGKGMTPRGSESSAPVVTVVDNKQIDASKRGGNSTVMQKSLAPKDRVTEKLTAVA